VEAVADTTDRAPGWDSLAERLLKQALADVRDGVDAIAPTEAAAAALRAEAGDMSEDQAGDLWRDLAAMLGDSTETPCTCPPDLRARGGYRSTCLGHGPAGGGSSC
jgi:hypothetical protein